MLIRLPKLLIVLALASSIGLHWAFLQAVAWTGMVVSYSLEAPISEAVLKTFDGQHPCKLCKHIAKAKNTEQKAAYKFEVSKLEFRYAPAVFIFQSPPGFWRVPLASDSADLLMQAPPVPPPRTLPG